MTTRDALKAALSDALPGSKPFSDASAEKVLAAMEAHFAQKPRKDFWDTMKEVEREFLKHAPKAHFPPKLDLTNTMWSEKDVAPLEPLASAIAGRKDPDVAELTDALRKAHGREFWDSPCSEYPEWQRLKDAFLKVAKKHG